jgi:photosystem II stability/assembly factor-like uncharacterized protein
MKIISKKLILWALLSLPISGFAVPYEVLELDAAKTPLVPHTLMFDITKAGERYIAVGVRGHIILSDDDGTTWRQAEKVPVRSDLLAVTFVDELTGWSVGHDSVILHTTDGGENWVKQFDGRVLGVQGQAYYQAKLAKLQDGLAVCDSKPKDLSDLVALSSCEELKARAQNYDDLIYEMEFAAELGADKPFFQIACYKGIHSDTGVSCNVAGAYGIQFRTDDNGEHWIAKMENVGNPDFVHLFGGAQVGETDFMVVGEMGNVWAVSSLVSESAAWTPLTTDYEGSLYTAVAADDGSYIAAGLVGTVLRSDDKGTTWSEIAKPRSSNIVDSLKLSDGRLVLIAQSGQIFVSADNGLTFSEAVRQPANVFVAAVEVASGELLVATKSGVIKVQLD